MPLSYQKHDMIRYKDDYVKITQIKSVTVNGKLAICVVV